MTEEPSLTERLADFLVATQPHDLPLRVVDAAKYYTLDWLGSAIAGTVSAPGRILLDYAASGSAGPATVIGMKRRRGREAAALVNGGLSHIVEMDDLHRASVVHPAAVVVPAALAAAQGEGVSGLGFLTAVVLGYEVAIRIGEAVGKSHYRFWHNTSTCGVFGAAAAAGWALGLAHEAMVWALGNAGTMAAGLWEFNADGAMTKHLHAGRAAANGLLAAALARRGFTGARRILEGERGFFAATSEDADPDHVVRDLASGMADYRITDVSIKPHASCRHTHPAIDAALAIRSRFSFCAQRVVDVEVETYRAALDLTDNPAPAHSYAAKFSLEYCTAAALTRGRVGLGDFTPEAISDPDVRRLMDRVRLTHSPEMEDRYPAEWPVRVTVRLNDGAVLAETVRFPKGDPENPLSWAELEAKFRSMVAGTAYSARAGELVRQVQGLDENEAAASLFEGLSPENRRGSP
jgi:2-methylcitrate dehydratase PrpD